MKTLLISALALGIAGGASAQTQLEASLGVEPGLYSFAELIQLKEAGEDTTNDRRFVANADSVSFGGGVSAGSAQIAGALGVEAGDFSAAELALLKDRAEITTNEGRVFFDNGVAFGGTSAERLAASLGVAGQGYSLSQLIQIKEGLEETDNEGRVFFN